MEQEGLMADEICQATRADGSPCRARALPARTRCFAHEPSLQGKATTARRAGGLNKANAVRAEKVLPRDLRPLLPLLVKGMMDVRDGHLEPARLSAMAAAAGAAVRLYSVVDADEIAARVAALEQREEQGSHANRPDLA